MTGVTLWLKHISFAISTLISLCYHSQNPVQLQVNLNIGVRIALLRSLSFGFKVMTSRLVNQSFRRHYYMLTTLSTTRRAPPHYLPKEFPSNSCVRSFTLSHSTRFQHNHNRAQSKISKAFPEAMDAIKQTVAQNMGIPVRALFCPLMDLKAMQAYYHHISFGRHSPAIRALDRCC